jgi:hypothetical protein
MTSFVSRRICGRPRSAAIASAMRSDREPTPRPCARGSTTMFSKSRWSPASSSTIIPTTVARSSATQTIQVAIATT